MCETHLRTLWQKFVVHDYGKSQSKFGVWFIVAETEFAAFWEDPNVVPRCVYVDRLPVEQTPLDLLPALPGPNQILVGMGCMVDGGAVHLKASGVFNKKP
jgi:hypothetical protein